MEGCEGNHELPELRGRQGEFVGNHGNSTWLKKKKKKSTRKESATQRENSGDTQRFILEYLAEH